MLSRCWRSRSCLLAARRRRGGGGRRPRARLDAHLRDRHDRRHRQLRQPVPHRPAGSLNWVDRHVHGQPVTYLGQEIKDPNGLWLTEFWNRSLKHVDSLDGSAPGPGPTYAPNLDLGRRAARRATRTSPTSSPTPASRSGAHRRQWASSGSTASQRARGGCSTPSSRSTPTAGAPTGAPTPTSPGQRGDAQVTLWHGRARRRCTGRPRAHVKVGNVKTRRQGNAGARPRLHAAAHGRQQRLPRCSTFRSPARPCASRSSDPNPPSILDLGSSATLGAQVAFKFVPAKPHSAGPRGRVPRRDRAHLRGVEQLRPIWEPDSLGTGEEAAYELLRVAAPHPAGRPFAVVAPRARRDRPRRLPGGSSRGGS